MGVLGGLFALGILTRRTTGLGALVGAVGGAAILLIVKEWTGISGYLYAAIGIVGCATIGYVASLLLPGQQRDLSGLTIYTRRDVTTKDTK